MSVVQPPRAPRARALVLTLACASVAGLAGQQTQPAPSQPTFRLDANFVRVDMYPTIDGRPVTDLTRDDVEIREDGVAQAIETFEHVALTRGVPVEQRRDPNTVAQMREEAENSRARLFVIFLDTKHTGLTGSHAMKRTLVNMLDRMLSQDDLFAVMTPYMSPTDLSFARKSVTVEAYLSKHWTWGERDWMLPQDPAERQLLECFPGAVGTRRALYSELAEKLVARRREKVALDSLTDLTLYLRGVREERKAVIAISNGWLLPGPDERLLAQGEAPRPTEMGTTPTGRITADRMRDEYGVSRSQCEAERQLLAYTNYYQEFQDLMETANRANVSFYPVDSRGLAPTDSPINPLLGGNLGQKDAAGEIQLVRARVESLRTLADNTDGLAVVDTNALDKGVARIVDDMTSYYLVGYYSSNTKLDGRYRKISVRVKRPGVDVRARRGYKALSAAELTSALPTTGGAPTGPSRDVEAALSSLATSRASQLKTSLGFWRPPSDAAAARLLAAVEIDSSTARRDFASGGDIAVVAATRDGTVLAQRRAVLAEGARSALVDLGAVPLLGRDVVLRTRVTPRADGTPLTETTAVASDTNGAAILWRRGPTTGMKYVVTADRRLSRADRVRIEVPASDGATLPVAALLDRAGHVMAVPIEPGTRTEGAVSWATGELVLAPLAPGEYVVKLTLTGAGGPQDIYTGIRVTP